MDPARNQKIKGNLNTDIAPINSLSTIEGELEALLHECFDRMFPHVWLKVVPKDNTDVENIAFAMGQSWQLIQALLVRLQYIKPYGDTFRINRDKFFDLNKIRHGSKKLNITNFRNKGQKTILYVCRDRPIVDNPNIQVHDKVNVTELRFFDTADHVIKNSLKALLNFQDDANNELYDPQNRDGVSAPANGTQVEAPSAGSILPASVLSSLEVVHREIDRALSLDLKKLPRYARHDKTRKIDKATSKHASGQMKLIVLLTMARWGYHSGDKTFCERVRISRAAARLVAYDNGYTAEFSYSTLKTWDDTVYDSIITGKMASDVCTPPRAHRASLVDKTEANYPGYLHDLYRESISIKGATSSFAELADQMNALSRRTSDNRPALDLNRRMLNRWFEDNQGKEISSVEKPLDTPKHKTLRKDWAIDNYGLLTCKYSPVCYIDEKWFYRVNRRRKLKVLPRGKYENKDIMTVIKNKMLSRRYPIKTMFMAVVGRPLPHRNFNGKIHIERVSETKFISKCTAHTNFSDDAIVNDELKSMAWKSIISTESTCEDFLQVIQGAYQLEEYVVQRLEFYVVTKVGNNGNTKEIKLELGNNISTYSIRTEDDKTLPAREVTIADVNLHVRHQYGDTHEVDCSCDSKYMLSAMDRVGKAIRQAYHWVSINQSCYIVMDNAGGHGTKDAINEYTHHLLNQYNIKIIWQIPRSPYTNVLDLGVWMSIQARVERRHFLKRCTTEALHNSVMDVWNTNDLDDVMVSVFDKLKVVFCNILRGGGGNDLVEEYRGKENRKIKVENILKFMRSSGDADNVVDLNNLDAFVDDDGDAQVQFV